MQKRALTLLEIMLVIFLITLITGAIGYNMKGTLDRGRAFRTEQAKEQLRDLLLICLAESDKTEEVTKNPELSLKRSGLAKDPNKLLTDGWGQPFVITVTKDKNDFDIQSQALDDYNNKKKKR